MCLFRKFTGILNLQLIFLGDIHDLISISCSYTLVTAKNHLPLNQYFLMQISTDRSVSIEIDAPEKSLHQKFDRGECIPTIGSIEFYEMAIAEDEQRGCIDVSNYWYLGVSYLLAGREDDAQSAWFVPLSGADETEADLYTDELCTVLEQQAIYQSQVPDLETEWLIRQHLLMLKPDRVGNILQLIILANKLDCLTSELLIEWQIDELLETALTLQQTGESDDSINDELLERSISALVHKLRTELSLKLIKSCLDLVKNIHRRIIPRLVLAGFHSFHQQNLGLFAVRLVEICQSFMPDDLNIYQVLIGLYSGVDFHPKAIAASEHYAEFATTQSEHLFASYLMQRSYLTAGNWEGYRTRLDLHRKILGEIINESPAKLAEIKHQNLIISSYFSPYIEDNPQVNKPLQNKLAAIYQKNISPLILKSEFEELSLQKKVGVLRIGYLASTLKEHSVGWLSRWLFHYHDLESFQVFIYCVNQSPENKFNHQWFRDKANISYYFNDNSQEVATQITADEIDILIDLDSLTFDVSCLIMAHKPAPVQATWLGWDASGLPAIDYFIVDPYVLPDDAQDYYQEKLWRLPQTYLAVDGFEVGIPTLNRRDLNIPDDAVVYFSSQGGYKRHPDAIRSQLKIIKGVPNSYFLIKGKSDPTMIRDFFGKIAEEEGVSLDRLRFLNGVPDEYTHRANLAIADIVLDTFPYNGATTTLETLWMGIPMVTQVGEQFAARNSYTFMLNAGIEEGIAWSEQEYIDWGIKLGLDRELRDKIQGKLRSGRTTAPIWNAKQFTLEMEQAYRQMWAKYQEQSKHQVIDDYSNN
ncbi:O-linked N-acetylglucosamine transferase, SPINDLY family protein [Chamaesiphon sp. VAR_48_metabat_135_sub]|uniref:O-linked N-acetylglucosamine transferase, SPINDLY family protein n=1 Tax=Chamaesiphon sp. VAR_48_metabat_135_sub TaxID=2964699 RepID=UPI00286A1916|nr:O-linked N-acetylglucosamine transferase, SPINDLY family protein [Chamaesiphon sp. VAR_48_metabat_135_sub]